jgi:glycosyltransferase involved in cell wall biosynthesis
MVGGKRLIKQIAGASRRIVVPANFVRDAHVRELDADPSKYRTIHYGSVALAERRNPPSARRAVLKELGLPDDARIVLGCGSVEKRKGADLFVQLARNLLDPSREQGDEPLPLPWFIWVGRFTETDYRAWLFHDLYHCGLTDRIRFIGPRSDPARYFSAAEVFALTSREDPCPLVSLEAMSFGLPVVAFRDAGGAPEVFRESGIAVPYLDVRAMADVIKKLLAEPEWRSQLGDLAKTLSRERFTWPRLAGEFLDILRADYAFGGPSLSETSTPGAPNRRIWAHHGGQSRRPNAHSSVRRMRK